MGNIRHSARPSVVLVLALFVLCVIVMGQNVEPIETDLCSLGEHPKQFDKKRVRVNARVESVVIEGGTWLESDSCGTYGVELSVPDYIRKDSDRHPDFKALDDAIRRQGNIGTVGKRITATFTGEFLSHSKPPMAVLTLERVENLDVKIEKPQR